MRTGAAAGTVGFFHEALVYSSDDEVLDVVVPFLRDGLDAGEPTIVTFAAHNAALVRRVFDGDSGIQFISGADQYVRPAVAIRTYQDLFERCVHDGAEQIRVVGDVPHPGTGGCWHEWVRYEAAINTAYDIYPVWGICPYDTRTSDEHVIADVLATHPHVATDNGHRDNPHFDDPAAIVLAHSEFAPHPIQANRATVVLEGIPTPGDARRAAATVAEVAKLSEEERDNLLVVTSELVTNAHLHGVPPISVELWATDGQALVAVSDHGQGPRDPLVGLVGPTLARGGRGLWLTNQISSEVVSARTPGGFTIRAAIGPTR